MNLHNRLLRIVGFPPMSHRPPLHGRFWLYCSAAYLIPVVGQVALPRDPGMYDELIWLVTLAPAFLLSVTPGEMQRKAVARNQRIYITNQSREMKGRFISIGNLNSCVAESRRQLQVPMPIGARTH